MYFDSIDQQLVVIVRACEYSRCVYSFHAHELVHLNQDELF
jgi:hypothetical protein